MKFTMQKRKKEISLTIHEGKCEGDLDGEGINYVSF